MVCSLEQCLETRKDHGIVNVKIFGNVYLRANEEGRIVPVYEHSQTLRAVPMMPQIALAMTNINNLRLWAVEIPEEYELDYPTIEARRRWYNAILYPDDFSHEGKNCA